MVWYLWAIIGVAMFIAEMFVTGFAAASFGVGCLLSAVGAFAHLDFRLQLVLFALGTLATFIGIRPVLLKHLQGPEGATFKSNVHALIGEIGRVTAEVGRDGRPGRVSVRGDDWRAIGDAQGSMPVDTIVVVVRVAGATVVVRPSGGGE